MSRVNATELKQRLGQYLEAAGEEPVAITKNGKPYRFIISAELLERIQEIEDKILAERALEAEKDGYLGHEATMRRIEARLEALEAS